MLVDMLLAWRLWLVLMGACLVASYLVVRPLVWEQVRHADREWHVRSGREVFWRAVNRFSDSLMGNPGRLFLASMLCAFAGFFLGLASVAIILRPHL